MVGPGKQAQKAQDPSSISKSRSSNRPQAKPKDGPERLKVVVRRLPPHLPEHIFWTSVKDWVGYVPSKGSTKDKSGTASEGQVDNAEATRTEEGLHASGSDELKVKWIAWRQGKIGRSKNKEDIPSRAYIQFRNADDLISFHRGYAGHIFRDSKGNVSQAVVEFAPLQKIPVHQRKPDSRQGTIDQDPEYLAFVENLSNKQQDPVEEEMKTINPKTTPLLEHIRAQKRAAAEAKANPASAAPGPQERKLLLPSGGGKQKSATVIIPEPKSDDSTKTGPPPKGRGGKPIPQPRSKPAPAPGTSRRQRQRQQQQQQQQPQQPQIQIAKPPPRTSERSAPPPPAPSKPAAATEPEEPTPKPVRPSRPADLAAQRRNIGAALRGISGPPPSKKKGNTSPEAPAASATPHGDQSPAINASDTGVATPRGDGPNDVPASKRRARTQAWKKSKRGGGPAPEASHSENT